MKDWKSPLGLAFVIGATLIAGIFIGSDGKAFNSKHGPPTMPEHVVEPYGSKAGTPEPTPTPAPIDPRIAKAFDQLDAVSHQLDAVNRAQNIAIGLLTKSISPSGVIDDGKTTWTLRTDPRGGFAVKERGK